ncbi:MAG: hypothetical protein K6G81_02180 [Lachnospiraceae bacterium]|nr:hypothetical protein [Lachnospiraceae bacterium]
MAKRNSDHDPYSLKHDAVDRLVNASEETSPEVSDEEIARVSGRKRFRIPNLIKVLFIKYWFFGATCFFFYLGLGMYVTGFYDMMLIMMAAGGVVTDLLTNKLIRFIEPSEGANDKYLFVRTRKYWSFILNILYSAVVVYIIYYIYNLINLALLTAFGEETRLLAVGPLLYGLFGLAADMLLVGARNLFGRILRDAMSSARKNDLR